MKTLKLTLVTAMATVAFGAYAQQGTGAALQADVKKLISDVKADVAHSTVTSQELYTLEVAVQSITATAHKPDPNTVYQLETVVKAALADGTITAAEQRQIVYALGQVMVSAGISQPQANALKQAVRAIYASSNISKTELQQIILDLQAIVSDLPKR